jgi:fumarylacetoacetate (FAA) hydrolase
MAPQLQDLSDTLNHGKPRHAFPFDPARCMAPLPRAYQRVDASAYLNHMALLHQARGAPMPPSFGAEPLMSQGASDDFLGPCDEVVCLSEAHGIDFSAGLAVITSDVPMAATPAQALDGIRLLMLANDVSLRKLIPAEQEKGFGLVQSKPATAFSPVAVSLDELGSAWDQGRVNLSLQVNWSGRKVGLCAAGPEMTFHFGQLIAHLCKTRNVRAGAIVGSGAVNNGDGAHGYGCIAEKRAIETIQDGQPGTAYLQFGDRIRIEMSGLDGLSLFGAIDQKIASLS